jgi:hypothetical protein
MTPLHAITCASLPRIHLERLAPIRAWRQVKVQEQGPTLWLSWPEQTAGVAELVFPLPGSELYERREGHWFAFKRQLPSFAVPDLAGAKPLSELLFPEAVTLPTVATAGRPAIPITLLADSQPREVSALRCCAAELHEWMETVPTARFAKVLALRQEDTVFLLGNNLPPIAGAQRYWGNRILTPLGFRYEPLLAEAILVGIFDLASKQMLLVDHQRMELVDSSRAQPLSRAAVKLALAEGQ